MITNFNKKSNPEKILVLVKCENGVHKTRISRRKPKKVETLETLSLDLNDRTYLTRKSFTKLGKYVAIVGKINTSLKKYAKLLVKDYKTLTRKERHELGSFLRTFDFVNGTNPNSPLMLRARRRNEEIERALSGIPKTERELQRLRLVFQNWAHEHYIEDEVAAFLGLEFFTNNVSVADIKMSYMNLC